MYMYTSILLNVSYNWHNNVFQMYSKQESTLIIATSIALPTADVSKYYSGNCLIIGSV